MEDRCVMGIMEQLKLASGQAPGCGWSSLDARVEAAVHRGPIEVPSCQLGAGFTSLPHPYQVDRGGRRRRPIGGAGTPRPASPGARSPCRRAASKPSGSNSKIRAGTGSPPTMNGKNTGSSSPRPSASRSTLPTSAVPSARRSRASTGSTRTSGRPGSSGTASCLCSSGVPLEEISRLVGHSGTAVTEEGYRKQIRPVIQTGAVAMDGIFGSDRRGS